MDARERALQKLLEFAYSKMKEGEADKPMEMSEVSKEIEISVEPEEEKKEPSLFESFLNKEKEKNKSKVENKILAGTATYDVIKPSKSSSTKKAK
jgi:hypothetical protein